MKVIWFCNIPLPKVAKKIGYKINYGGGWLTGISEELLKSDNIELTISFPSINKNYQKGTIDKIDYITFPRIGMFGGRKKQEKCIYDIIQNLKPDIIHIWGSEERHFKSVIDVCEKLGILNYTVLSIQGLVSVYIKHYFANIPLFEILKFSIRDLLKYNFLLTKAIKFKRMGKIEIECIKKLKNVIGRTDWDESCVKKINPEIKYYFCNEILRDEFYNGIWSESNCEKHSIFISQSSYPIKGFHLMVEVMSDIIRKYPDAHLYTTGNDILSKNWIQCQLLPRYYIYIRKLIYKYNLQNNITFLGYLDEKSMKKRLLLTNIYIQTSSIENSPNSLGEAMLLGVPCIASDVGGTKNQIIHNYEGYIYPWDEPYMISYYVDKIFSNNDIENNFSYQSRIHAIKTYSKETNSKTLKKIYKDIISKVE